MTMISQYYAKVGVSTDLAQLKKVDRYLKLLEAKMAKFHQKAMKTGGVFNINFKFNTNRLQFEVQKAFNDVSRRVAFPINRFQIDRNGLARDINSSIRQAMLGVNRNLTLNPRVTQPRGITGRAAASGQPTGGLSARQAGFAGGAAGIFGRYGGPAILGGATLYGGSALNRANQEIISAQLTTQAVVEAQGLKGEGPAAFEWLRGQGNRIGFSYLDQAQDYNNFLSNSLGAGRTLDQAQNTYLGFAEYARAMGTSPARQKLVMNALSQMEAKGTVSMEELRRQMAESMPGTMSVFAEALQRQTGGGLQGQEAMQALMEAVPAGKVKSDILPIVSAILRERAKPKLDIAMKTSQAEQARAVNLLTDFTNIASKAGLEEGFSRIFRTFTDGLSESSGLVERMARGFNELTKHARDLLLFPESFVRALEGRDSVIADWLGADASAQLVKDWTEIKNLFGDIMGFETPSWLPTLEATAKEIAGIMNLVAEFQRWRESAFPTVRATDTSTPVAALGSFANNAMMNIGAAKARGQAVYGDPSSIYYKDPAGYDTQMREKALAEMQSGGNQNTMSIGSINVEVNSSEWVGETPAESAQQLADKIVYQVKEQLLGEAWQMYPQTQ